MRRCGRSVDELRDSPCEWAEQLASHQAPVAEGDTGRVVCVDLVPFAIEEARGRRGRWAGVLALEHLCEHLHLGLLLRCGRRAAIGLSS